MLIKSNNLIDGYGLITLSETPDFPLDEDGHSIRNPIIDLKQFKKLKQGNELHVTRSIFEKLNKRIGSTLVIIKHDKPKVEKNKKEPPFVFNDATTKQILKEKI